MQRRGGRPWVGQIERHGSKFRFAVGDGGGAHTRESYSSKREAEFARETILKTIEAKHGLTMEEALHQYAQYKTDRGNTHKSVEVERARVARYFGRSAGPLPKEPTPQTAAALYRALVESRTCRGTPISTAEHQASLKAARRFGAWLVRERHWRDNPIKDVETIGRARAGEASKAQLSRDHGEMFFSAALACHEAGDAAALAALVCLRQGVRVSEIARRRVSHLDGDGAILCIPSAKSRRGVRDLPIIDGEVRDALREQARRARGWGRVQDPPVQDPPLFPPVRYSDHGPDCTGEHLSNTQVRRAVHRVCRAIGIPLVTTHALRGSFASRSAAAGLTLEQVAAFLGNSPTIAAKHYASEQSQTDGAALRATSTARPAVSR